MATLFQQSFMNTSKITTLPDAALAGGFISLAFIVALFSAGIGIGGGAVLMPAFLSIFNFDYPKAAVYSLATIIPIALTGAIAHFYQLSAPSSFNTYLLFIPMCVLGAVVSTGYLKRWNNSWLKLLFTWFLFLAGARMLELTDFPFALFTHLNSFVWPHEISFLMVLGFAIGLMASQLGIGCGLLIVPFFVLVMDFQIHQAICLSLTTIFFLSTASTSFSHKKLKLDLRSYRFLFFPALAGAVVGSTISGALPDHLLKQLFGLILLLVACAYLYRLILQALQALFQRHALKRSN